MNILTYQDWNSTIDFNAQGIVVLIFTAPWCDNCDSFKSNVVKLLEQSSETSTTSLYIADINTHTELVDKFNIITVPTTLVINRQKIVCRVSGAKIEELQKILV